VDTTDLMDLLADAEAILLEPRPVFDAALVGMAWRGTNGPLANYDMDRVLAIMEDEWGESAGEHFVYDVLDTFCGPHSPVFTRTLDPGPPGGDPWAAAGWSS
jgi:hypothetical protein